MTAQRRKRVPANADALGVLESWTRDDPALQQMIAEERSSAAVARQIYELRTPRGLTERQLADLVGTKQPVIWGMPDPADIEDAARRQQAFRDTATYLGRRIDLLLALPFESLERRALEERLRRIGLATPETAESSASDAHPSPG